MPQCKPPPFSALRIGLVRRGYSSAGGAESYLRGFAQAAVAAGHEVVLFCSAEWENWTFGEKIVVPGKSPAAFSRALDRLRPRDRCDVLFSLERVSDCDIYRAGDGVHAAWLERRGVLENPLKRLSFRLNPKHFTQIALEKRAMISARKIIANSRMVRDEIERFYGPQIAAKVSVVYNGIDPVRWEKPPARRSDLRKKFNLLANDRVVAFVGSGWERKGLRFAIEAAKRQRALLLVCGRGNPEKFVHPSVRFCRPGTAVADVLHAADAFILPTIYDPFSNATLEALAAGLPVITTQANGVCEILDPTTDGVAVASAQDVAALADGLEKWIHHPAHELRQQHAAQFSLERNFSETLRIIES